MKPTIFTVPERSPGGVLDHPTETRDLAVQVFLGQLVVDVAPTEDGPRVWVGRSGKGWRIFVHRADGQLVTEVNVPDDEQAPASVLVETHSASVRVPAPDKDAFAHWIHPIPQPEEAA
jgi:hypothetical protein